MHSFLTQEHRDGSVCGSHRLVHVHDARQNCHASVHVANSMNVPRARKLQLLPPWQTWRHHGAVLGTSSALCPGPEVYYGHRATRGLAPGDGCAFGRGIDVKKEKKVIRSPLIKVLASDSRGRVRSCPLLRWRHRARATLRHSMHNARTCMPVMCSHLRAREAVACAHGAGCSVPGWSSSGLSCVGDSFVVLR